MKRSARESPCLIERRLYLARGERQAARAQYLPLSAELVERFKVWQEEFDDHEPWAAEKFDWERHARIADGLARDLKQCVGPRIYVEHRELIEVLPDGTTRSCRPLLGLQDVE
jgi:hypothetical protein